MANRFNQILPYPEHVSSYIPLPLDLIARVGEQKQTDLDKHKKALEVDTDPLSKLGNLSVSLPTYSGKGTIEDVAFNQFEDYRQQALSQLSAEREQLATDLNTGKLSDVEFKQKAAAHTKRGTDIYNQLAGYKTEVDKINKYNEELRKNPQFGTTPYYGKEALVANTKWMKDTMAGKFNPFVGRDVAKEYSREAEINAIASNWTKEGAESVGAINGYIDKYGWKGITKSRVYKYATNAINDPTSQANQYANMNVEHNLNLWNLSGNETENADGSPITITQTLYKLLTLFSPPTWICTICCSFV